MGSKEYMNRWSSNRIQRKKRKRKKRVVRWD